MPLHMTTIIKAGASVTASFCPSLPCYFISILHPFYTTMADRPRTLNSFQLSLTIFLPLRKFRATRTRVLSCSLKGAIRKPYIHPGPTTCICLAPILLLILFIVSEGFAELFDGAAKVRSETADTANAEQQDHDYQDDRPLCGTKANRHYHSCSKPAITHRFNWQTFIVKWRDRFFLRCLSIL